MDNCRRTFKCSNQPAWQSHFSFAPQTPSSTLRAAVSVMQFDQLLGSYKYNTMAQSLAFSIPTAVCGAATMLGMYTRSTTPCRSITTVMCQSLPPPSSASSSISRREYLRHALAVVRRLASVAVVAEMSNTFSSGTLMPSASTAAAAPKETIINSVLSGYGLPTISDKRGFSLLTAQYGKLVVQFEHPSAWVVNRVVRDSTTLPSTSNDLNNVNMTPLQGRASGLTASDYRRAEGVAFFVNPLPPSTAINKNNKQYQSVVDVPASFIAELVTPGDATGATPEVQVVADMLNRDRDSDNEESLFRTIDTVYESTTVSGYTVERKARTRATVLKDGKLYALNVSCSAIRWKKLVDDFDTTLKSFRIFIL